MRSGAHVDPLTRQSPAFRSTGRIIRRPPWGRVKLAPIHSVSSWKFSKFSAWLCAGATVVRSFFEFRSVNLRFEPFVWLFDRWSKVFCCLRVICLVEVRVLSLVWLFAGKRWFLAKLWFSLKAYGVLEFSCTVSHCFLRLIADSIVVEVLFAAFL